MLCRYMERKINLIPEEDDRGLMNVFDLEYYLLESDSCQPDINPGEKVFGFEIVKRSGGATESHIVKNFCFAREIAKNILIKLADNTVTPVGLPFILDDLLGEL